MGLGWVSLKAGGWAQSLPGYSRLLTPGKGLGLLSFLSGFLRLAGN